MQRLMTTPNRVTRFVGILLGIDTLPNNSSTDKFQLDIGLYWWTIHLSWWSWGEKSEFEKERGI